MLLYSKLLRYIWSKPLFTFFYLIEFTLSKINLVNDITSFSTSDVFPMHV